MSNFQVLSRQLSRRRLFSNIIATVGVAGVAFGLGSVISKLERNPSRRQIVAPEDGLSLSEYLDREAPKMEVFPYNLLRDPAVRFRGTLTFERYLVFYRFKERVLASTKEEIDECVRQIVISSPKKKALILAAMKLYERIHRYDPSQSHYQNKYNLWRKLIKKTPKSLKLNRPVIQPTDLEPYEERSYLPGKRPYYPYCYPVLRFFEEWRSLLILGAPAPDPSVDKECSERWFSIEKQYFWCKEIAFPTASATLESVSVCDFEEEISQLRKPPIRFLAQTSAYYAENKLADQSPELWSRWLANIHECVALIRRELNLTIAPERWISDFYPEAEIFLQRIDEIVNKTEVSFEKIELLTALREYWFSMQIAFDYNCYLECCRTSSTGLAAFYDDPGVRDVSVGEIAYYF